MPSFSFIAFLLSNFILTTCFCQEDWQVYNSPSQDFYVSCPGGLMEYKSKQIDSEHGAVLNEVHYLKMPKDHPNSLYMITTTIYPYELTLTNDSITIDSLMNRVVTSLAESIKGTVKYLNLQQEGDQYIALGRIQKEDNTSIKFKGIWVEDSLYFLQVYTHHHNTLNDFISRFIDTFKIRNSIR